MSHGRGAAEELEVHSSCSVAGPEQGRGWVGWMGMAVLTLTPAPSGLHSVLFSKFIQSIPENQLVRQKLNCLTKIVESDLFKQAGEWHLEGSGFRRATNPSERVLLSPIIKSNSKSISCPGRTGRVFFAAQSVYNVQNVGS